MLLVIEAQTLHLYSHSLRYRVVTNEEISEISVSRVR